MYALTDLEKIHHAWELWCLGVLNEIKLVEYLGDLEYKVIHLTTGFFEIESLDGKIRYRGIK